MNAIETRQTEAQEILRELLAGEFRDLKDPKCENTWLYFIPMRPDWIACNWPFKKLRCSFIFIKETAVGPGKKINDRAVLRSILRHELLHVRMNGADDKDPIFLSEAGRLNIPLGF